jgi:hypothetical protein
MDQQSTDFSYFKRRASEEQAAAQRALDPRARQSHSELAERYSQAAETGRADGVDGHEADGAMPLLQPEFRILP